MHMATSITPFRGLLIGLLVHAAQATVAQSVGRVEMLPVVGATWHMRALQRIPELPQVVRPVVWPFADLEGNDVFGITYTMRDAAEVPLAAAYPEADQVLHAVPDDGSPATDIVLDVQPDRCLELLSTTSPVSCVYNPGALLAAYPLAFGAEMGVDHCFMTVSSSALTPYCGTTWITFERTGLLQLPFGEYPEANLIRTRRSKVNASEPSDSSMTETLTWYAEGIPYPLLRIVTISYPNGTQAHEGHILDPASIVGLEERSAAGTLALYPVPSTGVVYIGTPVDGELRIHSMDGKLVRTERLRAGSTPVQLDLSDLVAGSYRAVLWNERETWSAPLILAR